MDEPGKYYEGKGKEFLEKFFQTEIEIPLFMREDLEEYTSSLISKLELRFLRVQDQKGIAPHLSLFSFVGGTFRQRI